MIPAIKQWSEPVQVCEMGWGAEMFMRLSPGAPSLVVNQCVGTCWKYIDLSLSVWTAQSATRRPIRCARWSCVASRAFRSAGCGDAIHHVQSQVVLAGADVNPRDRGVA